MNPLIHMSEAAWLEEHHDPSKLSTSQLSSVLHRNPYVSEYKLYLMKTGELPWPKLNLAMRMGHTMEDIIAGFYEDRHGVKVVNPGEYSIHRCAELPGLFTTTDRIETESKAVEIKTGNQYLKKQWADGPPMHHRIQNHGQMQCVGVRVGAIAAFIGDNFKLAYGLEVSTESVDDLMKECGIEYHDHDFEYHDDLAKTVLELAEVFIRRCVDRKPPDPRAEDFDVIRDLHPMDDGGILQDDIMKDIMYQYDAARVSQKTYEEHRKSVQAKIMSRMGENTYLASQGRCMSWKHQDKAGNIRVSTKDKANYAKAKALLAEHNIPYDETAASTSRVLRDCKMPALEITDA